MNRKALLLAALAAAMVSACTSAGHGTSASTSPSHGSPASTSTSAGPPAQLTRSHPCAGIAGFACSTLMVPLDYNGNAPGTLSLQVAAADNVKAPRGVLLFLTGGACQPGGPVGPRNARRISPALEDSRPLLFALQRIWQLAPRNCPCL